MAYLKAIGVLRLVSEQRDGATRGYWRQDVFWLRSPALFAGCGAEHERRKALTAFLLNEYRPTPIVAPWAGGSGFFKKDNKMAVAAIRDSTSPRVARYADVIRSVDAIVADENVGDKPAGDAKGRLIRRFRRELPDDVVAWMDAAMVLHKDGQSFAPLLGTGGNDGRLDFTQNFMQRVVSLDLHTVAPKSTASEGWLAHALFADSARLGSGSVGQFAPGRAGGPNATQGMEGRSADDPWEFILMLEGALMFAGAAARRLGASEPTHAGFPFTVRAVGAGFASSAAKDAASSRGEIWLPLWGRPTRADELRYLFGEGRADVSGRQARNGADLARAVASLGVDRGIGEFARLGLLERSGKAFLATPAGRFAVAERREVDLLREIDPWLERLRSACSDQDVPERFVRALRAIDSAVFEFCRYGGPPLFQRILLALGRAEREIASAERLRTKKRLPPIGPLSREWLIAADDNSPEFAIALALVFIHDPEYKIGLFRTHLESVTLAGRRQAWTEKGPSVVWNAADLPTNLVNVLQRRLMEGGRAGCDDLPLRSRRAAPLNSVAAFIDGDLDDERVEALIWGLMLVDPSSRMVGGAGSTTSEIDAPPLAREYAVLKLLFLPSQIVAERVGGEVRWRLARGAEQGVSDRRAAPIAICPEPRIVPLLRGGRVGEACAIAVQRLRSAGLVPMPGPHLSGSTRDRDWLERSWDRRPAERLAAALLIPISSRSVDRLVRLVCRENMAAEARASAGGGTA